MKIKIKKIVSPQLLAALALLAATATSAAPPSAPASNPLEPFARLAGRCFKGTLPNGAGTDEHCFAWIYAGKALRDTHTVRNPAHADYAGETTYYWDSAARRIEYVYIENAGGIMRGSVEPSGDAVVFPPAAYVMGGQSTRVRARWTLEREAGYEAWSEIEGKEGWVTFFRVKMAPTR